MSEPSNPLAFAAATCGDWQEGMTLRDWFAGQALSIMTAAPDYSRGPCNDAIATRAYVIADAMLAERAKSL